MFKFGWLLLSTIFLIFQINGAGEEILQPPFVTLYQNQQRSLAFVAAFHGAGHANPTFQIVQLLFKEHTPRAVIIEGVPSIAGISPRELCEIAKRESLSSFKHCGESVYTMFLASTYSIPFIGGEPSPEELCSQVLRLGFSEEDVLGFYLVRQIPQWKRELALTSNQFQDQAKNFINFCTDILKCRQQITYDQFCIWYQEKEKRVFDFNSITEIDTAPLLEEEAPFLRKLSSHIISIRDRHLLQLIEKMLIEYQHIAVVYGAGHYKAHRDALDRLLGQPRFRK